MENLVTLVKSGKFCQATEIVQECLEKSTSVREIHRVLSACSHFVFNNKSSLSPKTIILVLKISTHCCKKIKESYEIDPALHVKLLFYVVSASLKAGIVEEALNLIESLCDAAHKCNIEKEKIGPYMNNLYISLWNLSLNETLQLEKSALFKEFALNFMFLCGLPLKDICDRATKAHLHFSQRNAPHNVSENFLRAVIGLINISLTEECNMKEECLWSIFSLLVDLVPHVLASGNTESYVEISNALCRALVANSSQTLNNGMKSTFMASVAFIHDGLAFHSEKNAKSIVWAIDSLKLPAKDPFRNSIIGLGLLTVFEIVQNRGFSYSEKYSVDAALSLLDNSIICVCNSNIDMLKGKVCSALTAYLLGFSSYIGTIGFQENELLIKFKDSSFLWKKLVNCKFEECHWFCLHNVGVHLCNLGVLGYKAQVYKLASNFLEVGIDFLIEYSKKELKEDQRKSIQHLLLKKAGLLKDCLRFSHKFKESTQQTIKFVNRRILPKNEIIATWIKCKRDDYKSDTPILKNTTIKHIFDEMILEGHLTNISFDESLLVEELYGLKQLSADFLEDNLLCAKLLSRSKNALFKIEGQLHIAICFWFGPDLCARGESAIKACVRAIELCRDISSEEKRSNSTYLKELLALTYFWSYLCHLQIVQETAKEEIGSKKESSEENSQTNAGDEEQPDDICSIRASSRVGTFSVQHEILGHLNKSLDVWKELHKIQPLNRPEMACNTLMAMSYIFKLSGVIFKTQECLLLFLSIAKAHNLSLLWIQGLAELLLQTPELISDTIATEAEGKIRNISDESSQTQLTQLYALCSLAYYYYKTGVYSKGVKLIRQCLKSPIMQKHSLSSTEVQILTLVVASCYALLPPSSFEDSKPKELEHPFFLAYDAARKSIGLLNFSSEIKLDRVCWNHQILWLHHESCMQLGRICYLTANPRHARAYLKQSISVVERLAIPLRTAETTCLLAEVDLLCDQYDELRVKIDSLGDLLNIHGSIARDSFFKELNSKQPKKFSPFENSGNKNLVAIYEDFSDGNLRESLSAPEYCLTPPKKGIDKIGRVRLEGRLPAQNSDHFALSPSLPHREDVNMFGGIQCPYDFVNCDICCLPSLHSISLFVSLFMAMVHSFRSNHSAALKCFNQSIEILQQFRDLIPRLDDRFRKLATSYSDAFDSCQLASNDQLKMLFYESRIVHGNLFRMFCSSEIFCKARRWEDAKAASLAVLGEVSKSHQGILEQNSAMVLRLLLQAHAVDRVISNQKEFDVQKAVSPIPSEQVGVDIQTPSKKATYSDDHNTPLCPGAPHKAKVAIVSKKIFDDEGSENLPSSQKSTRPSYNTRKTKKSPASSKSSVIKIPATSKSSVIKSPTIEVAISKLSIAEESPDQKGFGSRRPKNSIKKDLDGRPDQTKLQNNINEKVKTRSRVAKSKTISSNEEKTLQRRLRRL